ncbi:hypothetical protein ACQKOM_08480 [Peribacillus frigoritolerans]|uniref:hypothetical protein n=1 Tax=Peribacillus frigoritolerans TaxID=450367 RepID=UPI003D07D7D5
MINYCGNDEVLAAVLSTLWWNKAGADEGAFFKKFVIGRYMVENGNDTIALDGGPLVLTGF